MLHLCPVKTDAAPFLVHQVEAVQMLFLKGLQQIRIEAEYFVKHDRDFGISTSL